MSTPILPSDDYRPLPNDYFHHYVYIMTDATRCSECGRDPELTWIWEEVGPGEYSAEAFAIKAVETLKASGWVMHIADPLCADCAVKHGSNK